MQIGLLGPLAVRDGDSIIEISGGRLRVVLTVLALEAPRPVSISTLVAAVWGDEPPTDSANALQSLVSRLRRALGGSASVQQTGTGYRLSVTADDVDVHQFEQLADAGHAALRAGDPSAAATHLDRALALWRGDALDATGDLHDGLRTRLEERRLDVRADLIEARLSLGEAEKVVPELESLVVEHPLRERYAELLVKSLHASGRSAEALARYDRTRETLADALGVDPSADLQAAHLAVLRGEPPAAARRETTQGNLRAALTSFVGRDEQLVQIGNLLNTSRLVTLVGPGGAGKTRLAAAAAAAQHGGAVWVAELAPVTDPADVPQTVLGALGLRDAILIERTTVNPRDAVGRLVDALSGRRVLLVLDNCEHLVDAAALLADRLLAECPDLRILATSREPLAIFGEALVAVPPLEQPTEDAEPKVALGYAAVQLFADRARDVQSDFEIDDDTVHAVVQIVRRLDGLPLAIELAAARLRTLPVGEIERRLSDRFRLLTGGSRTAMPRHRTLHAVVDWSWDLLCESERQVAQRLAVFAGGITPSAAAAACSGVVAATEIDELLMSLVEKSLLHVAATSDGTPRYRMLETIREFGLERMAEAGVVGDARLAHAEFFAGRVAEADQHLRTANQLPWFAMLDVERDNVLAAIKYLGDVGRAEEALALVGMLGWHWMTVGNHNEIVTWISFALDSPGEVDPVKRLVAEAFLAVNMIGWTLCAVEEELATRNARLKVLASDVAVLVDSGQAPPMLALLAPIVAMFADDAEEADRLTTIALRNEDPWIAAAARIFRAAIAENAGNVDRMRDDAKLALAAFRELGERWGLTNSLQVLGALELMDGHLEEAAAAYGEALELASAMGSREDVATMRLRLADILTRTGDMEGALVQAQLGREAAGNSGSPIEVLFMSLVDVEVARSVDDMAEAVRVRDEAIRALRELPAAHPIHSHGLAVVLASAAKVELDLGNGADAAWPYLDESYDMALQTKDTPILAASGVALAIALHVVGRSEHAAEVLGASAQLRGADDWTQVDIARIVAELGDLDSGEYAGAYARGRAMTREEAIARVDPRRAR